MTTFDSDNERYVAWQVQATAPIVILDTLTGQRREVAGCSIPEIGFRSYPRGWPAGHGLFIVYCGSDTDLFDVRSGAMTVLPGGKTSWGAVGARYLEGEAPPSFCRRNARERREQQNCIALYSIATGAVSYRTQTHVANLDRPGAPLVCPALRQKVVDLTTSPGDYDGELFGEPGPPLRVHRCRGRALVFPDATRGERHEDLNVHGGLVSWDSAHDALECAVEACSFEAVRRGSVSAYSLATGRRWRLTPPAQGVATISNTYVGVFGYSSHTRTMLFWIATRTLGSAENGPHVETSTVYTAKL